MVLTRASLFITAAALTIAVAAPVPARGDSASIVPSGGVVRLSRAEYDKLKDSADAALVAPPKKKTAEVPPDVESASYEIRVEASRITLDVTADVHVKAPATDARLTLPSAGLLDALSDKGPGTVAALIEPGKGGKTTLLFRSPGRYRITARFVPADRSDGDRRSVEFTALPAASAKISATSVLSGAEFLFAPESGSPDEPIPAGAVRPIAASALVRVTMKTPARIPVAAEKPVVVAESLDVVRTERERITVRTVVKLAVSRAEIREFPIVLPAGSDVLSVFGPDEPQFDFDRASGRVTLKFARPWLGEKVLSVLSFRPAPKEGEPIEVAPARLPEATSSRSFLIVAPTPLRTPAAVSLDGVARTDVADLPPFSRPFTTGASRAYRVVSATARLVLSAPVREVINPPDTLIAEATLLTVFGDGKSRTDRRRYTIETRRAYFNAPLDPEEEILSVSVDQNPVKPKTDAGSLVVLLSPSDSARRIIDITTKRKGVSVPESGDLTVAHGPLPGTASLASWTIVLPEQRKYRFVSSTGIRKVGWSRDEPAQKRRYDPVATNWMGDGEKGTTSLAVKVTDEQGVALPGVIVEIQSLSQQATKRSGATDAGGLVRFGELPAGRFSVKSALSGFNSRTNTITASPGAGLFLPMTLGISSMSEVTVTAESSVVDTRKSSIGETQFQIPRERGGRKDKKVNEPKSEPMPALAPAQLVEMDAGVEDAVGEGVAGGVMGATGSENGSIVDGLSLQQNQAGVRSLPMDVTGHGKRLTLSGPLVGSGALSVTLKVKKA